MAADQTVKWVIHVQGLVQGCGFRPFVARLAHELGVAGAVYNDSGGVIIQASGTAPQLERFVADLQALRPPESRITALDIQQTQAAKGEPLARGFEIRESQNKGKGCGLPSPDLPVCEDCLAELRTPGHSRYQNPFISCTRCGPRLSVMRALPYDRPNTAMGVFPLCPDCAREYADRENRRCHSQTLCCNHCGPRLFYQDRFGYWETEDCIARAAEALNNLKILAIKGIGGYHLACSPYDSQTVDRLRELKGREDKPFALMFDTLASLKACCDVSPKEEAALASPPRPILLLNRKPCPVSQSVYRDSDRIGAFLPYTPIQHLLLEKTGPLVMTSANVSALPMITDNAEMLAFFALHPGLDGVLGHDRDILIRQDDSVAEIILGELRLLRQGRGYAPLALPLALSSPGSGHAPAILACGGQEKITVCFCQEELGYLSPEMGSLELLEGEEAYAREVSALQSLLRVEPSLAVCDLHPAYASSRYAAALGLPLIKAQHHHSHMAAVIAEHGLAGSVIGVTFDGTGYGTDGKLWGGEFLIGTAQGFSRAAHVKAFPLLGSDDSVRQCWKTAACLAYDAGLPLPKGPAALVAAALDAGLNVVYSSSMGRLFDGVSALLGFCQTAGYEAQGAILLENAARRWANQGGGALAGEEPFPYTLAQEQATEGEGLSTVIDLAPCIRAMVEAREAQAPPDQLALRFHDTVVAVMERVCVLLSQAYDIGQVALSGGVFANRLLMERAVPRLEKQGLRVYWNKQVPPGDAGLALGQAAIAQARAQGRGKEHVHSHSR